MDPARIAELRFRRLANATPEEYGTVRCPSCGLLGVVDEDQARGRVSIACPAEGCDYHETVVLE